MGRLSMVAVAGWLVIGVIAAGQRGYYSGDRTDCAKAGDTMLTVVVGPLNYVGANPKVTCNLPRPSK